LRRFPHQLHCAFASSSSTCFALSSSHTNTHQPPNTFIPLARPPSWRSKRAGSYHAIGIGEMTRDGDFVPPWCIFFFLLIDQSLTVTTSSAGREIANATPCRLATRHKDYFRLEDNSTKSTWMQAAFSERKDFETQISTLTTELSECNGRRGRLTTVNNKIPDRETRLASALKAKECECT
jgi:hypothetical protein